MAVSYTHLDVYMRQVDGPSHHHREQRAEQFIFQHLTDGCIIFLIIFMALYHFRVQKQEGPYIANERPTAATSAAISP